MKFFIHTLEGTGHMNACIGLSQGLVDRGNEVVFVVNEKLIPTIEKFGFRIIPLRQSEQDENNNEEAAFKFSDDPARDLAEKFKECGMLANRTSLEKIDCFGMDKDDITESFFTAMAEFNPQIEKIIADERPDCWIHDHFIFPPAIGKAKLPWILVASGNPLMYSDDLDLPPVCSGYPTNDRSEWDEYREKWNSNREGFFRRQEELDEMFNFVNNNDYFHSTMFVRSPYLTVYHYPKELDYSDIVKIPENMAQCDAFRRRDPEPFKLPHEFLERPEEKMIYFSMGSMGGFDTDMIQRIIDMLGRMPYKFIISKGPRGDELTLPDNCWGENYLPQIDIVEMVDLVITHGGNNTLTETFFVGKPMIVMPLFADQYDNAQRIAEKGYGVRLEPYTFEEPELVDAIHKLLNDAELHKRLEAVRERVSTENTKDKLCETIEKTVKKFTQI